MPPPCGQLGSEPTCAAQASCARGAAKPRHFHPASRPMLAGRRLLLSRGKMYGSGAAGLRKRRAPEQRLQVKVGDGLSFRVCSCRSLREGFARHPGLPGFVTIFPPLGHLAVQRAFRAVASKEKQDSCLGFPLWNQGLQR